MKRKRHKSTDSDHKSRSSASRPKTKKRANSSDSEPKEDGEISDDNGSDDEDDDDDLCHVPRNDAISQRKQIVYEIDDDSCSSSGSGRNSPYSAFSGEELTQLKNMEK